MADLHIIAHLPEIYAYKVPPLKSAEGYKAQDWNGGCMWSGRAFVLSNGTDTCLLKLENDSGIFIETPISGKTVIPTIDSSRFFVISVQDPKNKNKSRPLGIGFSKESNLAFEFLTALQIHKQKSEDLQVLLDNDKEWQKEKDKFSLKTGESISISIPQNNSNVPPASTGTTTESYDIASFSFAPPPKQNKRQQQ